MSEVLDVLRKLSANLLKLKEKHIRLSEENKALALRLEKFEKKLQEQHEINVVLKNENLKLSTKNIFLGGQNDNKIKIRKRLKQLIDEVDECLNLVQDGLKAKRGEN